MKTLDSTRRMTANSCRYAYMDLHSNFDLWWSADHDVRMEGTRVQRIIYGTTLWNTANFTHNGRTDL